MTRTCKAIVMDPEDLDSVGVHKNVCILDFAGLYPSMMVAYNTSWETKVKPVRKEMTISSVMVTNSAKSQEVSSCRYELDVWR